MIFYKNSNSAVIFWINLFRRSGSVFPFAFSIAFPCSVLSVLLEFLYEKDYVQLQSDAKLPIMNENAVWGGFTFLVGFLIVFRTSIAYQRFWDGTTSVHKMRAEWFDACSSICAFCKFSDASKSKIDDFQNTLIRLFSLLHAVALAEIEDTVSSEPADIAAYGLALIDDVLIDDRSLLAIRDSQAKVELAFQWIQQMIVESVKKGILNIPAPLLSRSFQELANGMVEFHEALKVSSIPFPFPYAQTCDFLLLVHGLMTPVVVTQWVNDLWWVFIFSFIQLFIMWTLRAIAIELENPFGMDANDLEEGIMQEEMNTHLILLVSPACRRTPKLQRHDWSHQMSFSSRGSSAQVGRGHSLMTAWSIAHSRDSHNVYESENSHPDSQASPEPRSPITRRFSARSSGLQTGLTRSERCSGTHSITKNRSSLYSNMSKASNNTRRTSFRTSGFSVTDSSDLTHASDPGETVRHSADAETGVQSDLQGKSLACHAPMQASLLTDDEDSYNLSYLDAEGEGEHTQLPGGKRTGGPELEPDAEREARDAQIRSTHGITASGGGLSQRVERLREPESCRNLSALSPSLPSSSPKISDISAAV